MIFIITWHKQAKEGQLIVIRKPKLPPVFTPLGLLRKMISGGTIKLVNSKEAKGMMGIIVTVIMLTT